MNLIFEITSYAFSIIIGIIFINWYIPKKGWEKSNKKMLFFVIAWKTVMLFLLIGTALLNDFIWSVDLHLYSINVIINTAAIEIVIFIINCLLGILFFEIIFKKIMQEVIIIIIVITEMIIDYCLLYPIFYLL